MQKLVDRCAKKSRGKNRSQIHVIRDLICRRVSVWRGARVRRARFERNFLSVRRKRVSLSDSRIGVKTESEKRKTRASVRILVFFSRLPAPSRCIAQLPSSPASFFAHGDAKTCRGRAENFFLDETKRNVRFVENYSIRTC